VSSAGSPVPRASRPEACVGGNRAACQRTNRSAMGKEGIRMRVAMVSEHASPLAVIGGEDAGGQNVHVAALSTALASAGHDVTVYTRRDSTSLPSRVTTSDGYVVEHVSAGPPTDIPKDQLLQYMPELGRGLARRWNVDRPGVVHSHFWMSGLATKRAVRGLGIPVVHTFHALGSVKRQ